MKSLNKKYQNILALMMISMMMFINASCSSSNSTPTATATPTPTATPTATPTPLGSVDIPVTLSGDFSVSALTPNPAAAGTGTLTLNRDTGALSGSITTSGLSSTTINAHIHTGLAGKAGGVVVALDYTTTANTVSVLPGTELNSAQMTELLNANYYINVHTADNDDGELRGQILPANFQVIRTLLRGDNVAPTQTGSTNTGIGFLTVNPVTLSVRGNITNTGLDNATVAHIHGPNAPAGLTAPPLENDTGLFVVNIGNPALWELPDDNTVSQANMDSILAGDTYLNVHSVAFPSGEIRGQILPSNFQVIRIVLSGDNVAPTQTGSTNTGIGFLTVNPVTLSVRGNITNTGLDNATVAHIHGPNAPAGLTAPPLENDTGLFVVNIGNPALWELPDDNTVSQANMDSILAGDTYLNVHSVAFPSGEIRGQIAP